MLQVILLVPALSVLVNTITGLDFGEIAGELAEASSEETLPSSATNRHGSDRQPPVAGADRAG